MRYVSWKSKSDGRAKKMSLESIRKTNQETEKRGDVEPEMGKHWIVRLEDITPKTAFDKIRGQ